MAIQSEQEVIGCIVRKNSLLNNLDLTGDEFSSELLGDIYREIAAVINSGSQLDIVTLGDMWREKRPDYLQAVGSIFKSGHGSERMLDKYATSIKTDYRKKQAVDIALSMQYSISEQGDLTAIDRAITDLMKLNQSNKKYSLMMDDCIKEAMEMVEQVHENGGSVGIPTGLEDLDASLGGFHNTNLTVIGARPAMGKTAMLLNMAHAGSEGGRPVGLISAEQGAGQIGMRMISIHGSVDSQKMQTASFADHEWAIFSNAVTTLMGRGVAVNIEPGISITTVISQAREWKHRNKIEALYVDYIQKIRGSNPRDNKTQQVTEVVSQLKNLARELNIPVIALAQVKREVDTRPDKRPSMGDMSDASEIEKEADEIMTLYRDEVYNEDSPERGIAEISVCKNRHGPIGVVRANWIGKFMQFKDIESQFQGGY